MSDFVVIRPRDDFNARQVSEWCDQLIVKLTGKGHTNVLDVDDNPTFPDRACIATALATSCDLVCYFGHGRRDALLTKSAATVDALNVSTAAGKAVVAIACDSGRDLGPDAITAGVTAWLGFTIKVPVMAKYGGLDYMIDPMVDGLKVLGDGRNMQEAHDELKNSLDRLSDDFDTGQYASDTFAVWGFFATSALRDHLTLHGTGSHVPL